ncbi:thioredoxin domain-containing protein [Streptomyces sp. WAC04114]|uniref:thioredoxin domain-containing protein n=1 Tax=Streptomyces sp. WAC04114 TaxID=2867961 RepID=UPI0027DF22BA|nr:thioredoxin domain-containing protein [Streptomyces sp. WAC04114]
MVLALAGCGQSSGAPPERRPAFGSMEDLPEKLGKDGTTIMVGDPDAKVKVHLYEDLRCPVCEQFETSGGGPQLRKAMLERTATAQYTLASFLDDGVGGSGSKKAVNALRAALKEGKFLEYHEVLYLNQPEESVDGYTDAYLLKLAGQVEGLRSTAFDAAEHEVPRFRGRFAEGLRAGRRSGGARRAGHTHRGDQRQADSRGSQRRSSGRHRLLPAPVTDPRQSVGVGSHHLVTSTCAPGMPG